MIDYNNLKTTNQESKQAYGQMLCKSGKSIAGAIKTMYKGFQIILNQTCLGKLIVDIINDLLDIVCELREMNFFWGAVG